MLELFDGKLNVIEEEFGESYEALMYGGNPALWMRLVQIRTHEVIMLGDVDYVNQSDSDFRQRYLSKQDGLIKKLLSNKTSKKLSKNYTCFTGYCLLDEEYRILCDKHEKVTYLLHMPHGFNFYTPIDNINIYSKVEKTIIKKRGEYSCNVTKYWAGCGILDYSKVKIGLNE